MKIQSTAFGEGESIPSKYTCDGENINPPLLISDVPHEASSLALVVEDPDSPRGDFVHWVLWNIDPTITEIPENYVPDDAVQGINSFGHQYYGGPCPGQGEHRYFFRLYALDTQLDISPESTTSELKLVIANHNDHVIERAECYGVYKRESN